MTTISTEDIVKVPAEEKPKEEPKETVEGGLIAKTTALVERQEAANKIHAELLDRQEKLKVQDMLGGTTEAGQPPPKPEELTDEEYAKKVQANDVPETKPE